MEGTGLFVLASNKTLYLSIKLSVIFLNPPLEISFHEIVSKYSLKKILGNVDTCGCESIKLCKSPVPALPV